MSHISQMKIKSFVYEEKFKTGDIYIEVYKIAIEIGEVGWSIVMKWEDSTL